MDLLKATIGSDTRMFRVAAGVWGFPDGHKLAAGSTSGLTIGTATTEKLGFFGMAGKRIRLVSMTLLPHFVVDDGEDLSPLSTHPRNDDGSPLVLQGEVSAAQWPSYATGKFLDDVAGLEARLNASVESDASPGS